MRLPWIIFPLPRKARCLYHRYYQPLNYVLEESLTLYVPAYSPKLNLVEYVIHLLRLRFLHHLPIGTTMEQIQQQLEQFLDSHQFLAAEQVQKNARVHLLISYIIFWWEGSSYFSTKVFP